MGRTDIERRAAAMTRTQLRSIGADIRRQRVDAGIAMRRLAGAAEVSAAHLSEIEAGDARPSIEVLNRIAIALDSDLSIRVYPNTGPRLRDRNQSRMIEALLRILHPRWRPSLEVPVHQPARGVIDCVLDDRISAALVATEAESDVRRLEQQIRWAREKAASVQSADLWPFVTEGRNEPPRVSRLLLLRSTRRSRLLAHTLRATFEAAYPADAGAVRAALTTANAPWPGDGLLWVRIDGAETRILDRRPPGVPGP